MFVPSTFLGQVFTRKIFAFAGGTLLIYDHLLTFSLEVTLIWKEPWSLVKSLFLINRYGNLIGQTFIMLEETGYLSHGSRNFCFAFQIYTEAFIIFSGESIRLFVVMRACAILGCRRRVALFISAVYVIYATTIVTLGIIAWVTHEKILLFEFLDELGTCILPAEPQTWTTWFLPLFLDSCVLVLVCRKLFSIARLSPGGHPSPLVRLLARDGLLFYIATLFQNLFFMVCWTVYSRDPRNFLQVLITYPFLSVVGQRLIFNLREHRTSPDSIVTSSRGGSRQIVVQAQEQLDSWSDAGFELHDIRRSVEMT